MPPGLSVVSRLRAAFGSLPRAFPRAGVAAVFAAPREARSLDLPEVALRDARIVALHEATTGRTGQVA